jgi:6-phosphogluconolactonase
MMSRTRAFRAYLIMLALIGGQALRPDGVRGQAKPAGAGDIAAAATSVAVASSSNPSIVGRSVETSALAAPVATTIDRNASASASQTAVLRVHRDIFRNGGWGWNWRSPNPYGDRYSYADAAVEFSLVDLVPPGSTVSFAKLDWTFSGLSATTDSNRPTVDSAFGGNHARAPREHGSDTTLCGARCSPAAIDHWGPGAAFLASRVELEGSGDYRFPGPPRDASGTFDLLSVFPSGALVGHVLTFVGTVQYEVGRPFFATEGWNADTEFDVWGHAQVNISASLAITFTPPLYSISGNAGAAEVTVSAGAASAVADSDGNYTIENLPAGTYLVTAGKCGCSASPSVQSVSLGADVTGVNFTTSCGPTNAQTFVYAANEGAHTVSGYRIDPTGALVPVPGSPFATGPYPVSVAVDPVGSRLYVANYACAFGQGCGATPSTVSAFTISCDTGALAPVAGSPFPAGVGAYQVTVAPSGAWAWVTNFFSNDISGYAIDSTTGALTPVPGSPFPAGGVNPGSIAVDQSERFAYVENLYGDATYQPATSNISAFSIDGTTGALMPLLEGPFPAGSGAGGTMALSGHRLYVADTGPANIIGYRIRRDGSLAPLPGSPVPAQGGPSSVTVSPSGRVAYVPNGPSGTLSAYGINGIGALRPIPGSPFPGGGYPFSVAVARGFAFATDYYSNDIAAYSIGRAGVLRPVPGSPFPTGAAPTGVVTCTPRVNPDRLKAPLAPRRAASTQGCGGSLQASGACR